MKNTVNTQILYQVLFTIIILSAVLFLNGCTVPNQKGTVWDSTQTAPRDTLPPPSRQTPIASTQNVTNVALLLPLSGRNAALGQSMLQAAQMALFEINNPALNLVPRDTKGTAQGAKDAAQSALDDGAKLILGPVFADSVRAVKPIAKQRNVNMIAFSTDQNLADASTFLMGFMPSKQASDIAAYAYQNNYNTVSLIVPRNAYGNIVTSAFEDTFKRSGGQIAQTIRYTPNDPDLGSNITAMSSSNVDAVFMPAGLIEARAISDFLDQNNMSSRTVKRLGTGLWDNNQITKISSLDGGWFAAPSAKTNLYFEQKYRNAYGENPVRIASLAFDATALAATLIQNAKNRRSSNAFNASAITDPNGFSGSDGVFRFNRNGMVDRKLSIFEIQNGKAVEVRAAQTRF